MEKIEQFIEEWIDDDLGVKPVFQSLYKMLISQDRTKLDFNERPGVSYSLRAVHPNQKDQPLFVMVDVIDDNSKERWLSICFYGDMIHDPDGLGDLIPEGLLGMDGYCFDIDEPDEQLKEYVSARIQEAYEKASIDDC